MQFEIRIDDELLKSKLDVRSLSFSRCLDILRGQATLIRQNKGQRFPTFILDNKLVGYNFAKILGYSVPHVYQAGIALNEVNFAKNTVVKPMYEHSAKGVFLSYEHNKIVYLNKNIEFSNENLAVEYAQNLINIKTVTKNLWMVEELLLDGKNEARDIKFYTFYGKVGVILETTRGKDVQRCWYDSNLNYVDTGKYSNQLYLGNRQQLEKLKNIAEQLSLEIPSPFVRIDFLVCDQKYYIGEFTPAPSGYRQFNIKWDAILGEYFLSASVRLAYDVSVGKVFQKYLDVKKKESEVISYFH